MNNALLQMAEGVQPVTVIQVDASLIHLLYEINERLRLSESERFTLEDDAMMIEQLKVKVAAFLDKAYANSSNYLVQRVILAAKPLLLDQIDTIKDQLLGLFDSAKFDASVDFLTAFVKGNISVSIPWYLRLLGVSTGKLVDDLGAYLKLNKALFKERIGSEMPPSVT